ncbi:AAA family ATPase [Paenilisteria newyorkensis]|uniref:AAA family ATPase n=1 Tax=Listeria newyorkensis TaxID=1497681 RepID=UPI000669E43C|nr:AAA family ATPase [Listeria newyorkensis]KMT59394.1 hypothetical protein X559_2734 [Listeria newyorkensis]
MIEKIDLSNYDFAFLGVEINGLKQKNFIYGKNGTGKTSIVKAIKDQCSEEFDLRIFDGWQGIIGENDRLDAISLGENNTNIQEKVLGIETLIDGLDLELNEPVEDRQNLYIKLRNATKKLKNKTDDVEKFFTTSAREITKTLSLGRNYNKNQFRNDINKAAFLTKDEITKAKETIKAQKINIKNKVVFPKINLLGYLQATNEILQTAVTPSGVIEELTDNLVKQTFAKEGMKIHSHEDGEICALCGNPINQNRWIELDRYFSDEVKKLDERIVEGITLLTKGMIEVDNILMIDDSQFYPEYKNEVRELNIDLLEKKETYKDFLSLLQSSLEDKKLRTTVVVEQIEVAVPDEFNSIHTQYNEMYQNNLNYSRELDQQQEKVKKTLRYHEVKLALEKFKYSEEESNIAGLDGIQKTFQEQFDEMLKKRRSYHDARLELLLQSTNETATVITINKLLKGLGSGSFELDHIQDDGAQKGQYRIKDSEGNERSIQTLSDGEKNIVAFLWFMNNLEKVNAAGEDKAKIIVFDDPMTSNDDNCQYLMMGLIQKFYREQNHPQMFLLTHNNHFYLQATPNTKKYPTSKKPNPNQKYIRLLKTDGRSEVRVISNENENLKPIYEELWAELRYAYENDKTIFMWNNMRRILETYNRFNYRQASPADIENQFDRLEDKALAIALVKSLNVNSHIGYETDIDISGKNRDELKEILAEIFCKLGAEEHFNSYWINL